MTLFRKTLVAAATLIATLPALADVTIGISLPLTGPASGLGIPMANFFKLWPATIAGEKVNLIVLDDATDPTKGVQNAKRFVTEDKVDLIIGSAATPVAGPMADVAAESGTVQLAASPVGLPPGKDGWTFRLPQGNDVMAHAMVGLMKKQGVKTIGFLGYTDAYGELWLKAITAEAEKNGMKIVATERFARADTSVTAQALKLTSANPDAMLVVASGSGAAMPHKAIVERGYKGKIYQTHAAATMDLMRVGGKDVEGSFVVSGPAMVGDILPDTHPSKKLAKDFVTRYEKAYGHNSANQFAGHAYDAQIVLEKVLPVALKKAKPGTKEFRVALKDAIETMGPTPFAHGVMSWTKDNHWGYTMETGVMLVVKNGDWALAN
ncbi:MAG TPA: ABC transporter substrate-binding protein [Aquabacterium sp.]|nr:ABC transporter substrate-binding protein [Aquabacterium sp.]HQC95244.1 ABC transporter substrate-binding protein [Aquabacterium sp.]